MKKHKIATQANSDMARTPKEAMAPKADEEAQESEKERMGEMDLDHLVKAEDIKKDPKKMEYVHKAHEKKTTAMRSIADLKMASQALAHKAKEDAAPKAKPAQGRIKTRYPKK